MVRRFCFGLIFLAIAFPGSAQFKNIRIDDVSSEAQTKAPSIVINHRNVKNIVAAYGDNVYSSFDDGATWTKSKVTAEFGFYGDPVLISNDKGDIFNFHSSNPTSEGLSDDKCLDQIICQVSEDGGKTWDAGNSLEGNLLKDHRNPSVTVDNKENLYLTWTQFDKYQNTDPNCLSTVMYSKSSNGKKWSKPKELAQTPGNCADNHLTVRGAVPVLSLGGKVFAAWSNQNKIFMDRSFDGDMWLSNDLAIEELWGECDHCYGMPVLVGDNSKEIYSGSLYLIWSDQRKGSSDATVWFKRSKNFGDNWSSPETVSKEAVGIAQYKPRMVVDKITGYLYVIYYARKTGDSQTDVYVGYSTDGGSGFKNVKLSETPFVADGVNFSANLYCDISAHKGIITALWTRLDSGKISLWTTLLKQEDLAKIK